MNAYLAEFVSLLLAATALALLRVRDLFSVALLLCVYSGLLAVLFALLGAVDVAFTEAVVGAGVSTVLFMVLMWRIDPKALPRIEAPSQLRGALLALGLGVVLLYGVHALPAFGDPHAPAHTHLASEYIRRSMPDAQTPNVVTAVLADFRGFDTLIETAVVLTAALACLLVMGKKHDSRL